jgi:hypothetical protein
MDHVNREELARLGWAVIKRAARDATCRALPSANRDDARAFLAGGPMFAFWADVAGLNVNQVQRMFCWSRDDDRRADRRSRSGRSSLQRLRELVRSNSQGLTVLPAVLP